MPAVQGYDEAARAIAANVSPRYIRLEETERWKSGEQYNHMPSWWTGGAAEVPRWERKPCIVYPVVDVASGSNTDLMLGEGRFPEITSRPGEDEGEKEGGLNEPDSQKLDSFLVEYHKLSRFKAHCREALTTAQASGTAIAINGHRNGRPFADLIPAKWGNPKLGADRAVTELEIRYPYLDEVKGPDGKWTVKAKLYRRVITETEDIVFFPAEAREDGAEPKWTRDDAQSITHNLGFCPVVWYPFMRGCAPVNEIDGKAIHANLKDEIHGLDLALSTHHTCLLNSEPQPVEIGVDNDYNPTGELGRMAVVPSTERGGMMGEGAIGDPGKITGAYLEATPPPARKKGGGFVWRYPNEKTKVEYLAFPTGLLKEQEEACDAELSKIEQALAVVLPKPSQFKFAGAVSGKALRETKSRQFDRCDQYRDDFEAGFLIPSVNMQLRIAQRAREQLKVPGIGDALPILDRFDVPAASEDKPSPDAVAAA